MKRLFSLVCAVLIALTIFTTPVSAYSENALSSIEYYSDGSYCIIEVLEDYSRAAGTKNGTKNYSYYSSDNELLWVVSLTGSFTYTGTTSTCTASNVSVTIYNSSWYAASRESSKSGNVASGTATVSRKVLGITVETKIVNLTLTCDANGNLS